MASARSEIGPASFRWGLLNHQLEDPRRSREAPTFATPGAYVDPKRPTGADRRDAASVPNEATVLELLRSGERDAIELGLDAAGRRPVHSSPGSADARALRQYNHVLKSLFKGAATTVITQHTKNPIYACYERMLDGGTKPTLAKLSLARSIAATVLRKWATEKIRKG